jgi:RNA polymerase-binding transcription factor DksA
MKILTNVVPTKELEAAVAAELKANGQSEVSIASMRNCYGYCPDCGEPGVTTERRIDGLTTCAKGHKHRNDKFTSRP